MMMTMMMTMMMMMMKKKIMMVRVKLNSNVGATHCVYVHLSVLTGAVLCLHGFISAACLHSTLSFFGETGEVEASR